MGPALLTSFAALCAIYLFYAAVLFCQQRYLLYPGARLAAVAAAVWPEGAQAARIPASFGHVRTVLLPAAHSSGRAPAVIFLHGNDQTIEQLGRAFEQVRALGMSVLLVEYPGYGGSPGSPSFATLREASSAAFDWLVRQPRVDPHRIIAMGYSIGGGPACQLSVDRPVCALVLLSTFGEIGQFARERWLPGRIVLDRFDNLARVREFNGPVLVFHGRRDAVIPFASGVELARAARDARLVPLARGHDDCRYQGKAFALSVAAFLRSRGVLHEPPPRSRLARLAGVGGGAMAAQMS